MKALLLTLLVFCSLAPLAPGIDYTHFSEKFLSELLATLEHRGLGNKPIAELPAPQKEPGDELSLLADYEHAAGGSIPVYLINRSGGIRSINSQDSDIYLKLEFEDTDGVWKRAQSHQLSWCGNSYMSIPLLDGHFIALRGYQPPAGERARIRFRLYRQPFDVVSNIGEGIISRAEAEAATREKFTWLSRDFDTLAAVARGDRSAPPTAASEGAREAAIYELGTRGFARDKVEQVLRPIAASGEEKLATMAQSSLKHLGRNSP